MPLYATKKRILTTSNRSTGGPPKTQFPTSVPLYLWIPIFPLVGLAVWYFQYPSTPETSIHSGQPPLLSKASIQIDSQGSTMPSQPVGALQPLGNQVLRVATLGMSQRGGLGKPRNPASSGLLHSTPTHEPRPVWEILVLGTKNRKSTL